MDYLAIAVALVVVTASSVAIHLLARVRRTQPGNLPPGSLGLPVIGQSLGLLRAMRGDGGSRWIQDRIDRYGPVSKLSLFGKPTVLLAGPAANKFLFFSGALSTRQPRSVQRILGEKSILDLHGADHRRVRGALLEFLRPDMLKAYVGRIDGEVRRHLEENWAGRATVTVLPLMKRLTFDIISALLFGLERGAVRDALAGDFVRMIEGMWAVPVNLPFTAFSRSLKASGRARRVLQGITLEKKKASQAEEEQGNGKASRNSDLITCLLGLTDGHGERLLTDEEIVDNAMVALIAGHDTSSILMTFMVRHLANDDATLAAMVQEHEEIAKNKGDGEALTWEDLSKMKFTWRVAQETLRVVPPIFGNFRRALEDTEFDGYLIPKGWQVFWTANVTHMDASIFHEPAKFDPSRFETENQRASAAAAPCSFVAFGGGPRICPGIEFSRIETLVTMHHLVRQFRWKLCCKEDTFVRNPMPSPLLGLPVKIEHRASS
ncbi:cytochrome P450 716B1-like [Aegilops tauschii subsp. strangulata]|uniref:cytochrome P450 716B1-like n=1 Tax=Aegilops tauschii subsp. strangulata TaxID=200361 RepID=UPI00098AD0F8|nr:cytochrome P450 716B1-like [Aegilops tauschii subsp. strangulata]